MYLYIGYSRFSGLIDIAGQSLCLHLRQQSEVYLPLYLAHSSTTSSTDFVEKISY